MVVGAAVWWRDALIRLFGSVTVVSVVLSLGESRTVALPWALLAGLPIADDTIPDRFLSVTSLQGAMLWQAANPMGYAQVGGGGPGIERPGGEAAGQAVLARVSFSFTPPVLAATDPAAVRSALEGWGVTTVVVPDQADLPPYDQIPSVPVAVALLTAATGEAPVRQARAWVWADVRLAPAPVHRSDATFARCTAGVPAHGPAGGAAVAHCVLAAPTAHPT